MSVPNYFVGIGASAGGLAPIEEFFDYMPTDSGMAFVIVQHLSPDFKSLMDELLARHTRMAIHQVVDGIQVEANSVYLIPPEKNMTLSDGKLLLTDQTTERGLNLPIDIFFRSLAKDVKEQSIAIVLSGTGSDGSRGILDVHEAGGIVLAQDSETAGFDGMPRSANKTGIVDISCSPKQMAERVLEYSKCRDISAITKDGDEAVGYDSEASGMFAIVQMFRARQGIDFSLYKPATIVRRLERRMQIGGFSDLDNYVSYLQQDDAKEELDLLFRDLLVEVTQFFRDTTAFEQLRNEVIPEIVKNSDPMQDLRVWVPGCATGEEAYSIAMLVHDAIDNQKRTQSFKIFATDVHRTSLETASTAVYSLQSIDSVPPEFQTRYFNRSNGLVHVKQEIRQQVIFAANDLTNDPPFTRIDLISCRNVLIYLEPNIQKRILALFHFGLKTGGVLFLGPSETVGDLATEFTTLDRHWRIYSKRRDVRLAESARLPMTPVLASVVREPKSAIIVNAPRADRQAWVTAVMEDLVTRYVPPSLIVNELHELLHTFGDARKLLLQPEGRPTMDALKMMSGELRTAVSTAIHRARQENVAVTLVGIRVQTDDGQMRFKVTVEPYRKTTQTLFLICLEAMDEELKKESTERTSAEKIYDADAHSNERLAQLEQELNYTRETLQATVEELESSNEELQATNEELVASNEELQSTNEELHSVNEELYTVNSEHKQKIEELTQLTNDMDNLLKSTDIGTIFLDHEFCIRMYTPAISAAFNIMEQDIGRPIDHIAYKLDSPNLLADAADVLRTGVPREVEVQSHDGSVFLQRIQPYRGEEDIIEGIVLTTTDISAMKIAEQAQRTMMTLAQLNEELPDFAYAVSHDLQAPLRHISQYSQVLEAAVESSHYEKIPKATKVIHDSAATLRSMIDALLAYSRINTRGRPLNQVGLADAFEDATHNLSGSLEFHRAKIECEDLPTVTGDRVQLETLFYHILDNAIKYCDEESPSIRISSSEDDDMCRISVSDNGIGIAPRHADRIFTIFKRLGYAEEVPGIGIGLALCKRIVIRHGGRIWLESKEGGGSVFHFTLREHKPKLTLIEETSEKLFSGSAQKPKTSGLDRDEQ